MAKRRNSSGAVSRATTTAEKIHVQDTEALSRAIREQEQRIVVPLNRISPRTQDTRPLNPKHVTDLKESIVILGLIEPLVVDQQNTLLAGGHRLAAIQQLKEEDEDLYLTHFPNDNIPVRVIPFDAVEDPERALQIEVAENEHRRDYTPAEVRGIAEHLREAGYEDVKGRPKKDQKPLMPALSVVVGKNLRTVQRYLHGDEKKGKSTTSVVLSVKKAAKELKKWQKHQPRTPDEEALAEKLPEILSLMQKVIEGD